MHKDPKTLLIIECKTCGAEYFGNDERLTLHPGDENELPDTLTVIVKRVGRCSVCKVKEDRTKGGKKKRVTKKW